MRSILLALAALCMSVLPTAQYKAVKVCPLVSLAEVKKFAPWPAHMDAIAKAEEESMGAQGSACNYPNVRAQVLEFHQQTLDSTRKTSKLEPVAGVGDEAYVRNNKDRYAELIARVGAHMLTVQMAINDPKTFDTTKPDLIGLSKVFAAKLK